MIDEKDIIKYYTFFKRTIFDPLNIDTDKIWIAGGSIREYILNKSLDGTDLDFYFTNADTMNSFMNKLEMNNSLQVTLDTKNAYNCNIIINKVQYEVDIIKRFHSDLHECINSFDFTMCCFAMSKSQFVYKETAIDHLRTKQLVINTIGHNPVSSFKRIVKFSKRGYSIHNAYIDDYVRRINEMKPENLDFNSLY